MGQEVSMTDQGRSFPSKLLGFIVIIAGCAVMAGWLCDIPALKSVLPGLVAMKANTAVGFIFAGLSLALLGYASRASQARWWSRLCAAAVALLSFLTLCQYLFGLNFGMDQWLFRESAGAVGTLSPGRMAPLTALNFLVLASALVLTGYRRAIPTAQRLVLCTGFVGMLPLIGYLYGATAFVGIGQYTLMAVHTSLLFVLLSIGVLLLHPADGVMQTVTGHTKGGWLLRHLAPFVVGIPLLLGWLRVQGERDGYFASALGTALMMIILMLLLLGLICWTAHILNQHEAVRRQADDTLRQSEEKFSKAFQTSSSAITITRAEDGKFLDVNDTFTSLMGFTREEAIASSSIWLKLWVHEEDRQRVVADLRAGQAIVDQEYLFRTKSGGVITGVFSARVIQLSHGPCVLASINDITARKRAEEELLASRQIIEGIINAIPARVFWKDNNLVLLGGNAAFARDAGFADPKDIIGKDDYQMSWRAQAELYRNDDRRVLESGCAKLLIEESQTTPAGKTITLLTSKIPLRGSHGEVTGILGTYMDITERKAADAALRASELRYRRLFESAKDGILILDAATGMIVDVNPFLITLLGFSHEQFLSKKLWEIGFFADIVANEATFVALQQQQYVRYEDLPLTTWDGRSIDVEFVSNVYEVDHLKVIQCNIRDITMRKHVENELARNYERQTALNTLLGFTLEGITLTEYLHRALDLLLSLTWLAFESKGAIFLADKAEKLLQLQVHQGFADDLLALCATVPFGHCICGKAAAERTVQFADHVGERHDTSYQGILPHGHYCVPILSGDHVLGVINLYTKEGHVWNMQDEEFLTAIANTLAGVIERHLAEAQRVELEEQLRQQQRLETVGKLAAGVAHDFNNLLTGITGFTQFAHDALPAGAAAEDLQEVLALAGRATVLTRQLLAFSRRQTLQPIILNMNELIGAMMKMLGQLIGEHIELLFYPAADLGAVKVDPGQFEQVLVNLAVNARDAMADGGKLTITTANVELDEDYARVHLDTVPGPYVMLAVADNGCGMEASILEHIFEPFFSTKGVGKGTGLGLATVYGIVKQHGGNIWVYSEPGIGTTFKVYLPLIADEISREAATVPAESSSGAQTILIVEDNAAVLEVATRILEQHGYRVLTAALPSQADEILAEHGHDIALLFTDVVMPERSGRVLYQSAHARYPHLRVLYMSGYTDDAIVHQGILDAGTPFIQKPFTADALLRMVRTVLREELHDDP
jgi:PAS domain S-box-containing protein